VTDFGIARTVDVEGVTLTGVVLGTSHYISPEQASGEPVDAESDVYSLGAVLYELLTGEVPFPGDNFVTVAMRHLREPAPSVLGKRPEVPLRVVSAVERALQKDPAARFGSMDEFVDELQACLDQLGAGGEYEPTMIVRSPARSGRPRRGPVEGVWGNTAVPPGGGEDGRVRTSRSLWPLVALLAGLAIVDLVGSHRLTAMTSVMLAVALPAVGGFYLALNFGAFEPVVRRLAAFGEKRQWPAFGHVVDLGARLQQIWQNRRGLLGSFLVHLAAVFLGAAEVWIALLFMGHPVSPAEAIAIESIGQGARGAAFVLPAYGVSLLGLVGLALEAFLHARRWKKQAEDDQDPFFSLV